MTGLKRIISVLAIGAVLGLGVAVPGAMEPAEAKSRVGRFFNKVGDAIVNNPLTKRSKRNRARTGAPARTPAAGEPARETAAQVPAAGAETV